MVCRNAALLQQASLEAGDTHLVGCCPQRCRWAAPACRAGDQGRRMLEGVAAAAGSVGEVAVLVAKEGLELAGTVGSVALEVEDCTI